jgi:hypothetical protein
MSNAQIEELDQHPVVIALADYNDVPVTPTTLRYRLDCETTATQIIDWTDLAASSTVYLTIPSTANAIVNNANVYETKRVTVQANSGTDQQLNKRYLYDVLNNSAYT